MIHTILIVENVHQRMAVLKASFRAAGYAEARFIEAPTPKTARENLHRHTPDLVVIPVHMDGVALLEQLKAPAGKTPILIMGSRGSREKVQTVLGKGAAGYIKTPFTPDQLRSLVEPLIGPP